MHHFSGLPDESRLLASVTQKSTVCSHQLGFLCGRVPTGEVGADIGAQTGDLQTVNIGSSLDGEGIALLRIELEAGKAS